MQIPTLLEYLPSSAIVSGFPAAAWFAWKISERFTRVETKIDERYNAVDTQIQDVAKSVSELRADLRADRSKGGF